MSAAGLRPLLQLRVTACPSTTSAEGLMRSRATGGGTENRLGEAVRALALYALLLQEAFWVSPLFTAFWGFVADREDLALDTNSDVLKLRSHQDLLGWRAWLEGRNVARWTECLPIIGDGDS